MSTLYFDAKECTTNKEKYFAHFKHELKLIAKLIE